MENAWLAAVAVGVPEMAPVDVLNDNPAESAGEIVHEDAGPPVLLGVAGVMAFAVESCV
jgi:hypothetical protein